MNVDKKSFIDQADIYSKTMYGEPSIVSAFRSGASWAYDSLMEPKPEVQAHNVGASNYAELPNGYQPWDIWEALHIKNPWDADILKRVIRTKVEEGQDPQEARKMDYEKIIHICQKRIDQINRKYEL